MPVGAQQATPHTYMERREARTQRNAVEGFSLHETAHKILRLHASPGALWAGLGIPLRMTKNHTLPKTRRCFQPNTIMLLLRFRTEADDGLFVHFEIVG